MLELVTETSSLDEALAAIHEGLDNVEAGHERAASTTLKAQAKIHRLGSAKASERWEFLLLSLSS